MKSVSYMVVALGAMFAVSAQAQMVSVPQLDRGTGAYVPQFQTMPDPMIRQLPDSARPIPRAPATSAMRQQSVQQTFVFPDFSSPLPSQWEEVSDPEPIEKSGQEALKATVGSGTTVIFTPQAAAELPTVGAGAVMR